LKLPSRLIAAAAVVLAVSASLLWWAPDAPQRAAIRGIRAYQHYLSPYVGRVGIRCRFQPSCSNYALASIGSHGLLRGGWRSAVRIVRCGPWTPFGTIDPP
jgi:putative membrane protein insertion efficiency factor